jgi:hypothetical protein
MGLFLPAQRGSQKSLRTRTPRQHHPLRRAGSSARGFERCRTQVWRNDFASFAITKSVTNGLNKTFSNCE